MLRNNKTLLLIFFIIAVAAYFLFLRSSQRSDSIKYVTSSVDRGSIISSVTANGTLQPNLELRVHPEVSGIIRDISVDINENVSRGQTLAKINPDSFKIKLNEARAKYNKASADLNLSQDTYEANKTLLNKDLISKQELDISRVDYKNALAAFEEARTSLKLTEENLDKTDVKSSIDGVVLSKNVTNGQLVSNSINNPPLFTIADGLENINLVINVSEADIGKIQVGQPVSFKVSSFPLSSFKGDIIRISNSPSNKKDIVTYDVTAAIDNSDLKLKPGMTAEVQIMTAAKNDVLRVPTAALRFVPTDIESPSSDKQIGLNVWLMNSNNRLTRVPVKTGVSNNEFTEITDNSLHEGQEIVIDSYATSTGSKSLITLPQPKRF